MLEDVTHPLTPRRPDSVIKAEIRVIPGLRSCSATREMHELHGSGPLLVPLVKACELLGLLFGWRGLDRHPEQLNLNEPRL